MLMTVFKRKVKASTELLEVSSPLHCKVLCMTPEEQTALKREPVLLGGMSCRSVDRP